MLDETDIYLYMRICCDFLRNRFCPGLCEYLLYKEF